MEVLINNQIVMVDGEDICRLNFGRGWGIRKDGGVNVWFGKNKSRSLHRVIMDAPRGMTVDHINGNRLDNRKENLRVCTNAQNACNRSPEKVGNKRKETHPYKGIIKHSNKYLKKKWFAQIGFNGKAHHSKRFFTEEEAARAYDELAKKHHGEFARLNFPEGAI